MASTADWITQRYGEATCTLAVQGQSSALSRWTDQPLLKFVSFQLKLQPAAAETAPPSIEIQGDGAQLQALSAVVQTYVQQGRLAEVSGANPGADIRLTPLSLTQHQFHPGALVVQGADPPLTLGTLQLYDLATVLDQFEANALVQPPLAPALTPALSPVAAAPRRSVRSWRSRRTWQVAASLVFAAGVTASVAQLVWRQPQSMLETSADRSTDAIDATPAAPELEDMPETAAAPGPPETQLREPLSAPQAARQGLDRPQAVQAYLQALWQPPAGLSQPLNYRLVVDGEGAIATLTPLDEVSMTALDQTPLAAIEAGEPVFGPSPDDEATSLIVNLNPDGRVEVAQAPAD